MADTLVTLFRPKLGPVEEEELRRENEARYLARGSLGDTAAYLSARGGDMMGRGVVQAGGALAGVDTRTGGERQRDDVDAVKAEVAKLNFNPDDPKSVDAFYREVIRILQQRGMTAEAMQVAKEYQTQKAAMTRADAAMSDVERKRQGDAAREKYYQGKLEAMGPKLFPLLKRLEEIQTKLLETEEDSPEEKQLKFAEKAVQGAIAKESGGKLRFVDTNDKILVFMEGETEPIKTIVKGKKPGTVGSGSGGGGGPKAPKTSASEREMALLVKLQAKRNNGEFMTEEEELLLEELERKRKIGDKGKKSEADLDATARTKIALQRAIVSQINRAWEQLALNPDAVGLDKAVPGIILDRFDTKGVPARAAISDIASALINARSGAAVSEMEFRRLEPFVPQKTDNFKTALAKMQQMYAAAESVINGFRKVNGLEEESLPPLPPVAQARVSARAKQNPATGQTAPSTSAPAAAPKPTAPAAASSAALPPAAAAKLKEGVVTQFGNGQKWTLKDGKPVQVQ